MSTLFLLAFVMAIFAMVFYLRGGITGGITGTFILDLKTVYSPGENIQGTTSFSMRQGEFLPASTTVSVLMSGETYDYLLSDLIENEITEGDFSAEGTSLSGSGNGYGVIGERTIYPDVEFVMKVTKSSEQVDGGAGGGGEEPPITGDVVEEIPGEEPPTEEQPLEEPQTEQPPAEEPSAEEQPVEETPAEEPPTEEQPTEEPPAEEPQTEVSPITGAAIALTSAVIGEGTENIQEITATVSVDNPYVYELAEGETVEIISSTQNVELVVENGVATVTTDYSETEQGFGQDYFGDYVYNLEIDLSLLNLMAEEGNFVVSLVYDNEEIASVSTILDVESPEASASTDTAPEPLPEEIPEPEIVNETIETNVTEVVVGSVLTNEEIEILRKEVGTTKVEITKAEVVNDRLVVRFEIGSYWLESSYDYAGDATEIKAQVELDREKWLKVLIKELSETEPAPEQVPDLLGEVDLGV